MWLTTTATRLTVLVDPDQDDLLANRLDLINEPVEQVEIRQIVDVVDDDGDQVDGFGGQALRQEVRLVAEVCGGGNYALALLGRYRPRFVRQRPARDGARDTRQARDIGNRGRSVAAIVVIHDRELSTFEAVISQRCVLRLC